MWEYHICHIPSDLNYPLTMTTTLSNRDLNIQTSEGDSFCSWTTSTNNRNKLYLGWFGVLMIPTLFVGGSICFITALHRCLFLWTSMTASVNQFLVHSCMETTSSLVQLFPLPTRWSSLLSHLRAWKSRQGELV